jgi:putative hydrolase of the HAD superfamily
MASVSAVLFDAGGVLLDLDYAYLVRLVEARNCETTTEALARAEAIARKAIHERVRGGGAAGEAWRDYFRVVLGTVRIPPELHEEIIDTLWEAHLRVGLWTAPIPGAKQVLEELRRRGLATGVVSNAEGNVARDLDAAGFGGLLDVVVDSQEVGVEKPDPRIFEIALERLGAAAEAAVFVGDVPAVDVEGAKAAGIVPVLVDRHDLYSDLDVARLRSLEELPSWIASRR